MPEKDFHIKMPRPPKDRSSLPTTNEMVDETLITLNDTRGVSLQKIKKYISGKYTITVSKERYEIIKSHLRQLLNDGRLVKTTGIGMGLVGSMRLVAKKGPPTIKGPPAKAKKADLERHDSSETTNSETDGIDTPFNATEMSIDRAAPGAPNRDTTFDYDMMEVNQTPRTSLDRVRIRSRRNKKDAVDGSNTDN